MDPLQQTSVRRTETADVVLISMPFAYLLFPSIALGLLKAALTRHQVSTKVLYLTFPFAEAIGTELYTYIANSEPSTTDLVGEWLFAAALFRSGSADSDNYVNNVLRGQAPAHSKRVLPSETFIQNILNAQSGVDAFLDQCVERVLDYHPKLVGFTSVFQQQVAALALAQRIKERAPETRIVFGGANCEGAMGAEVIRRFSFVDAVVSGEGDLIFPQLALRVLSGERLPDMRGVYTRAQMALVPTEGSYLNTPTVRDLDALPIPDYDDFFDQLEASTFERLYGPRLVMETSRGCWWGEKKHCTFCGLNGATMVFRSKSASRALGELLYLVERHPDVPISVVDNILDMKYFKDFVPELAARELGLELFYEVKSNLSKAQVSLLSNAGITRIQPGIESFSTPVLQLMKKGVTGLQNVQLLKWCKELGIEPAWNIIWGFPGEAPQEYARMADLIPLMSHLQPPGGAQKIRLDRFSPHFDHAAEYGFTEVEPYPAYYYIYPFEPSSVANLAYFFTFQYRDGRDVSHYTERVSKAVEAWQSSYEESDLFSVDKDPHLLIWDLRPSAQAPLTTLTGLQRALYLACDSICPMRRLQEVAGAGVLPDVSAEEVEKILQPLLERGLMIREGHSYLALAVPLGRYSPGRAVLERLQETIKRLGASSEGETVIPLREPVQSGRTVAV